jgi:2-polyprenyl-3-methyl-5-hydroxy-6-metoxy-1,4-benzoquinol methylase
LILINNFSEKQVPSIKREIYMCNDINHFNNAAKTWDDDPMKIARAKAVADEILKIVQPNDKMNAMEFGAGTGQLSFMLQPHFGSITLIDEAAEMLKVADTKIKANLIPNISTKKIDILSESYEVKHDMIYTLMVLHHVKDTEVIISKFNSLLNMGGYLCIADLEEEDGSFHSHIPGFDGHNGYNLKKLSDLLKLYGFTIIEIKTCFTITKGTGDLYKEYPVFVLIARK